MRAWPTLLAPLLLAGTPALAQEEPEWWVVTEPPRIGGSDRQNTCGLWLPSGGADREGRPLHADRCGHHAALLAGVEDATYLTVAAFVDPDGGVRYDADAAVLVGPAGAELTATGEALGEWAPGRTELGTGRADGVHVTDLFSFPPLPADWTACTLRVPPAEPDAAPLRARLEWTTRQAEADLEAWRAHATADRIRARSAIAPYLDCDGYRDLRARGDRYVVPLLLRELDRGEAGRQEDAVPRFLVSHVLADTDWGGARDLRSSGDGADAAALLRAWRDAGAPTLPGVAPE